MGQRQGALPRSGQPRRPVKNGAVQARLARCSSRGHGRRRRRAILQHGCVGRGAAEQNTLRGAGHSHSLPLRQPQRQPK